jgi:dolichol-phosphate mannosyltransferase
MAPQKQLSVVVPTYDETDNLRPLTERLFAAAKKANLDCDLLFADDESRGSEASQQIVQQLRKEGFDVRLETRARSQGRGLSSAVLLGFARAKYDTVLCMDADLQHEPESVPDVAAPVLAGRADFSVGSRHVGGGGVGFEWNVVRVIISAGATLLARPLCTSTDPMSGFFCTTKAQLAKGKPRPLGFKVGLEVMVRCRCTTVEDVPITFRERTAGESKLSAKQNVEYLQQLAGLYWFALRYEVLALLFVGVVLVAYVASLVF